MTENEKRKVGDDLMTCFVIHVSLLPLHIPFGATLLKAELLQICKQHKPTPNFLLDKILKEYGHDCLRLPAYHADLNSIELIWARMKGYIARRNVSFKMRKYWGADIAVEAEMEKIVIQVTPVTKTQTRQQSAQTIPTQNQQTKNVCAALFCIVLYCILMK